MFDKHILALLLLTGWLTAACANQPNLQPTTNVDATIDAAVAATAQAQPTATPNVQATVDTAVAATAQAEATLQTQIDEAVEDAVAENSATTEAELAALIDQAVAEAVTATQTYATTTGQATTDGQVTPEEVEAIQVTVQGAEEAVATAEALIATYYTQYGELAQETLDELAAIEEELNQIEDNLETMNETLAQGVALAEETVTQLQSTAQAVTTDIQALQTQAQGWARQVQAQTESRLETVENIQPNQAAASQAEAIQQALQFVELLNNATTDGAVSPQELAQVAQAGANAAAGLETQGGPQLQELSSTINDLTQKLAQGDIQAAQAGSTGLQAQLGAAGGERPSLDNKPALGGDAPDLKGDRPAPGGGNKPNPDRKRP